MPRLSLKVELLLGLVMSMACRCGPPPEDTGWWDSGWWWDTGDSVSDFCREHPDDPSCPCRRVAETGLAEFYFTGAWQTSGGEFSGASFGYATYGLREDDWICTLVGDMEYDGPGAPGCPDCEWSFDLSGIQGSTADGMYCREMGFSDGGADGMFDYDWGYAPVYYYDYGGTPLAFEQSVMLYINSYYGWFPFAFNYGGRTWVYGDSEDLTAIRPAFSGGAYYYYYYYTGDYHYSPSGCSY